MSSTLAFLLIAIFVPLVVAECGEVSPWLARQILCWGARRLGTPEKIERYTEEWLADLERVPGKVTKLIHAGCVVILGVLRLRPRRAELDWQPRPIISPFDTDSIFGPANSTLTPARARFVTPTPPLPPRAPTIEPSQPVHRCGSFCGLECIWNHDAGTVAFGPVSPRLRLHSDAPEPGLSVIERWLGAVPDKEHRNKYVEGLDLFDDLPPAYPPVFGA